MLTFYINELGENIFFRINKNAENNSFYIIENTKKCFLY